MSLREPTGRPKLVIIAGPTGVGKTAAALALAGEFDAEIVSADSMQVYRYLDIGTAKPTVAERRLIPHHLIDCVNPDEEFNAARFLEAADRVIAARHREGKNIFVVGGTGLYIRVLLGGLLPGPEPDAALRKYYRDLMNRQGREYLHAILKSRDAAAAQAIEANDAVRIIRALEYLAVTGRSITAGQERHGFQEQRYEAIKIGLCTDRPALMNRIERRAAAMIAAGIVEETRAILTRGYLEDLKPMQSLGYKHICAYLEGRSTLAEAQDAMTRDTKKYAKRQLTWFKAEKDMIWMSPDDLPGIRRLIKEFLPTR